MSTVERAENHQDARSSQDACQGPSGPYAHHSVRQTERRHLLGVTWEWAAESGTRYQLFWQRDTHSIMLGVNTGSGWVNTVCSDADGIRRFPTVKDARAFAHSFVAESRS